ncbi:MAG TPA: PEP-CTERM sorting domain-containing protein [Tepidisphaeraceae bacterium]|nr:PEP-CTERM sorting domain-containing protein [Tepidisphaeraceae bacterium]
MCFASRWLYVCLLSVFALPAINCRATVIWNSSVNGPLSTSGSTPTPFTLASGTNSIISTVGGGSNQNWVEVTIPTGLQLSQLVLASYQSTDAQGFTGVQAGSTFVGSTNSASSYLGYGHFGTGATNGTLPATNLVGADILPIMGNTADAPGSQGFTPPLASGNYVLLIQQLGASTNYQFDFNVTSTPEPAGMLLLSAAVMGLLMRRRRRLGAALVSLPR